MVDVFFLIGRIFFGGYFILYGVNLFRSSGRTASRLHGKRIPYAEINAYIISFLIGLGGIGIILGLYTTLSLSLVSGMLLILTFMVHDYWNQDDPRLIALEFSHFVRNLALLGAALMLISVLQPWAYSL